MFLHRLDSASFGPKKVHFLLKTSPCILSLSAPFKTSLERKKKQKKRSAQTSFATLTIMWVDMGRNIYNLQDGCHQWSTRPDHRLLARPTVSPIATIVFDPRPSTNQSTSLKSGSLFLLMVSVRPYINLKRHFSSDHWSQAMLGLVSYWMGDRRGTPVRAPPAAEINMMNHFSS